MKTINLSLILLTVFLVGLASAALDFSPSTLSLSGNHNTQASASFVLNNTYSQNLTVTNYVASDLTGSAGTIASSAVVQPSKPFLAANGGTTSLSYKVNIPQYQAVGTYTGSLGITSQLGDGTNVSSSIPVTLTVSSTSAFTLDPTSTSLTKTKNSSTITVRNTGNTVLSGSVSSGVITDSKGNNITLHLSADTFTVPVGNSSSFNVYYTSLPSKIELGTFSKILSVTSGSLQQNLSVSFQNSFCQYGDVGGELDIESIKDKSSEDDFEWKLLDNVQIDVKVRNNLEDNEDVTVKIELYDPDSGKLVEFDGDDEQTTEIADDSSETLTFDIQVPSDIDISSSSRTFYLYAKAYVDGDEDTQCTDKIDSSEYQSVKISKESREVTLSNFIIPTTPTCGDSVQISAKAYNIGRNDEDKVYVNLNNKELGINLDSSSFSLDTGDGKTVFFTVNIPQNVTDKAYTLRFTTYYDYDEDDETYGETSESISKTLTLSGCRATSSSDVSVSALLASDAVKGDEMIVNVTLVNLGTTTATYSLTAAGYENWASLDDITPYSLTLASGAKGSALIKLTPSASGAQTFKIRAVSGSQIKEQTVTVDVASSGLGFSLGSFGDNWFIWLIVLINVILIILIIIVAIRMSR